MTLQEAQQLMWSVNTHHKVFIDHAEIRKEPDGHYALVIEPLEGEKQIFTDMEKAYLGLSKVSLKDTMENTRYFTLAEDGTIKECDRKTWNEDSPNRQKTQTTVGCSSEVEANICFTGWMPPHADGEVKLWNVTFRNIAKNEVFGGTNFGSYEEAKAFVDAYISKGCPPGGFTFLKFLREKS
jgi:hypothetical protein